MAIPTDYNDTIIPQLNEYVASCNREATELPTHEGFAIKLGVNTDTIQEWKDNLQAYFDNYLTLIPRHSEEPMVSPSCELEEYHEASINQLLNNRLKKFQNVFVLDIMKTPHTIDELKKIIISKISELSKRNIKHFSLLVYLKVDTNWVGLKLHVLNGEIKAGVSYQNYEQEESLWKNIDKKPLP